MIEYEYWIITIENPNKTRENKRLAALKGTRLSDVVKYVENLMNSTLSKVESRVIRVIRD